jgi:hypothetical protein
LSCLRPWPGTALFSLCERHVVTCYRWDQLPGWRCLLTFPRFPGRGAMFLFLDRVGDIFDLGNASAFWGWVRYCYLFPKCAWRVSR